MVNVPYLLLMEDSAEAVEELEGCEDLALHQDASDDRGRGPPSCADGHLEEPLFQWQLAQGSISAADDRGHAARDEGIVVRTMGRSIVVREIEE